MKPDGEKYYEYPLVYVDHKLCISHNTKAIMNCNGRVESSQGRKRRASRMLNGS